MANRDTVFGLRNGTNRALGLLAIAAMLAGMAFYLLGVTSLPGLEGPGHGDFDMFHVVARLAVEGRLTEAYDLGAMHAAQIEFGGVPRAMTWTYPPPFDLVLAPLGLVGREAAYAIFVGVSLALYLVVMARLSGRYLGLALIGALPAVLMSVRTGQNGCLTAGLAGLVCLLLLRGKPNAAGLPLGLLVIKPHLGLGLGLWCLGAARWRMLATSAGMALLAATAATLAFGPEIWGAFLGAVGEARAQLEHGRYHTFRMTSLYAALTSLGVAGGVAITVHWGVALVALAAIAGAARRLAPRPALALALLLTPVFSPYLYDYDLALYGPALALLLPELDAAGRRAWAPAVIALSWIAGGTGMVQTTRGAETGDVAAVTLAGLATVALAAVALAVLPRQPSAAIAAGAPAGSTAPTG